VIGVLVAVVAMAGLSAVLAWSQYQDGRDHAVKEQRTRAVLAAALLNTLVAGQVSTLQTMAAAPSFTSGDPKQMEPYLAQFRPGVSPSFTAGMAWIDAHGVRRVSSDPSSKGLASVTDRSFFQNVIATGKPYVSEGMVARSAGHPRVYVIAVPTHDARGAVSGVLAGGILLKPAKVSRASIDLGFAGTDILDRKGVSLLAGFARPRNTALVAKVQRVPDGVIRDGAGLNGQSGHVVAYATAALPAWTIVLDRPSSAVFASANHQLELDLALIAVVASIAIGLITFIVRRMRRELAREFEHAQQVGALTHRLARASVVRDVSEAFGSALQEVLPTAGVAIVWTADDQLGVRTGWLSRSFAWPRRGQRDALLAEAAEVGFEAGRMVLLPEEGQVFARLPSLPEDLHPVVRGAVIAPLASPEGRQLGAAVILRRDREPVSEHQRTLIASHAQQAAGAYERARRYEREHEVAVRLQRGLLPERLPDVPGLDLAARYQAGTAALEIGGDWYDVVRRNDGIVHAIVGDVAGRGLGAAMVMGELRTAFRAYSFDYERPADVMRHLSRHVPRDEMVTAICLAIDPYTGEVRYASAGHPPALLLEADAPGPHRFAAATIPPLGFVDAARIVDELQVMSPGTTAVLYTDGLVERRGQSIDDGISRIGGIVETRDWASAGSLADALLDGAGGDIDASDDIALLVVRLTGVPDTLDIRVPGQAGALGDLRRRLRVWLEARGVKASDREDAVLAASEACNNAIEHGYAEREGDIRVRVSHADGALEISITDAGSWREPAGDPARGRGISIMERLADDVDVRTTASGTVVVLRLQLETPA
jgi:serine phosphatase RsbU (regulator of sigma subunit)/anti-sigma regulatory factor (Ser/Thr protein kinase)